MNIIYLCAGLAFLVVGIFLFRATITLFSTDSCTYRAVHKHAGSLKSPFTGVIVPRAGLRDSRLAYGMAYNTRKQKLTLQSTLSQEELDTII